MAHFEVQQHFPFSDTWENTWTVDDKPETFNTRLEAEVALADHISDSEAAVLAGDIPDCDVIEDFRIVEVND